MADAQSDLAQMLQAGQFGLNLEPGRPRELAAVLNDLAEDPARLRQWSEAGEVFARQFEAGEVLGAVESVLMSVCGNDSASSTARPQTITNSFREMLRRFRLVPKARQQG